jgi:hypothetical protein
MLVVLMLGVLILENLLETTAGGYEPVLDFFFDIEGVPICLPMLNLPIMN